jgi:hypothetical protein
MRREAPGLSRSREALAVWQRLGTAYDEIARALEGGLGHELAELVERVAGLEHELGPMVSEIAALRSRGDEPDPSILAIWREIDAVIASLAARQPFLVRAAVAARAQAAEKLAGLRDVRTQLHGYAAGGNRAAPFASRYA